jgi:hypothetical protein
MRSESNSAESNSAESNSAESNTGDGMTFGTRAEVRQQEAAKEREETRQTVFTRLGEEEEARVAEVERGERLKPRDRYGRELNS